jgi:hypothetical protein
MSDVSAKCAAAANMECDWMLVDDLMGGTRAMRRAGHRHMPQWPLEHHDEYKERLHVATLLPAYSETVATMAGRVFSKPISVGDDVPEPIADAIVPNVDAEGRNLHVFAQDWFETALNHGLAFVLVDFPRSEAVRTKAEEKALGLRPNWILVRAPQVLGWRSELAGDTNRLTQFRFRECITVEDGEFGHIEVEQVRVLEPNRCRLYRLGKDGWEMVEDFPTSQGVIPLVPLYTGRTGYMTAKPPLLELAHLNVKHWQSQSDQDTILHTARVPLLARIGVEQTYDRLSGEAEPMKINKSMIDLPLGGDVKYVEHTGAAIKAGQESLNELEEQMKTAGAKLLTQTVLSLSEGQSQDEQAKEISQLASMAEGLEEAIDAALAFTASWMGLGDSGGHVQLTPDLGQDAAPAESMKVLITMNAAGVLSSQLLFEEAKRRGLISDDVDWEEEQQRINDQAPSGGAIAAILASAKTAPAVPPPKQAA